MHAGCIAREILRVCYNYTNITVCVGTAYDYLVLNSVEIHSAFVESRPFLGYGSINNNAKHSYTAKYF